MKISTEIGSAARIVGEEKALEYLAKAGFDAWDFSMFAMWKYDWAARTYSQTDHPLSSGQYLSFAKKLKQIGLDYGIVCNQSHAPFPSTCAENYPYFQRAIECTAEAGGEICIIHPNNDKSAQENAEMYGELLPPSPTGHVGAGLGLKNSGGSTGLIPPTRTIAQSGERLELDGLTFVFLLFFLAGCAGGGLRPALRAEAGERGGDVHPHRGCRRGPVLRSGAAGLRGIDKIPKSYRSWLRR